MGSRPRRAAAALAAGFGLDVEPLLAQPDAVAPALLLPFAQRRAAAYAVADWSIVDSRWKLARRSLAHRLVRTGLWPPVGAIVTVCRRDAGLPAIIEASRPLGLPEDLNWVLTLGRETSSAATSSTCSGANGTSRTGC